MKNYSTVIQHQEIWKSSDLQEIASVYIPAIKVQERTKIHMSRNVFEYYTNHVRNYRDNLAERFIIIPVNRGNYILGWYEVSTGGIGGTVTDIKMIIQQLLLTNAYAAVIIHNHPSGNVTPSEHDIKLTKRIKDAMILFEMILLDHIIVSEDNYYSFADEGTL